jgi:hypothetical protein
VFVHIEIDVRTQVSSIGVTRLQLEELQKQLNDMKVASLPTQNTPTPVPNPSSTLVIDELKRELTELRETNKKLTGLSSLINHHRVLTNIYACLDGQ